MMQQMKDKYVERDFFLWHIDFILFFKQNLHWEIFLFILFLVGFLMQKGFGASYQ
jgi:hypothetical protein